MNSILVSVIIPIYNNEKYLRECLDSVINQTLREIEIICVNDGSTDGSPDILEQYALRDKRIRVIHKNNTGYGHSMNVGMDNARGEYIAFVESDDYIEPGMLKTLYQIAEREKADIVKANFASIYGDGDNKLKQVCKILSQGNLYNMVLNPGDIIDIFRGYIANWAGIYRRDFINKFNIRHNETPGASYQDVGFWFQVNTLASKIYFTDNVFYMYRQDNPNSSVKNKGKVYCICDEYQFIYNFLTGHPELYRKYIYIYQYCRYTHYMFSYNRIADEFKHEFLKRFQTDFLEASSKNELDLNLFYNHEKQIVQLIMSDPDQYYRQTMDFPIYINNLVQNFSKIIIYGAGRVGKEILHALMKSDAIEKLVCFAVTDLDNGYDVVEGILVKEIGDLLEYRESAAVIVAVTELYKDEMLKILQDYKFEHPILIN